MSEDLANAPETDAKVTIPALNIPTVENDPDPVAPGESAETSEAPPEPEKSEDDQAAPKKPKVTYPERISQITAARRQAEADATLAWSEVARLKADLQRLEQQPLDQLPFEQQDAIRHRTAVKEAFFEEKLAAAQQQEAFVRQTEAAAFQARIEAVKDRIPDFAAVVMRDPAAGGPVIGEFGAHFIANSEKGPEIAYYLAKNTSEALRIDRLPVGMQGAELARIEARVTAAPTVRKASQAPAPVATLGGSKSPAGKEPSEMTMTEYIAWRNGGDKKRA